MGFYIFIIIIATFLFHLTVINHKKSQSWIFFYVVFLLLLSFLGGLRDLKVGTDVLVYGVTYFENAKYTGNLFKLWSDVGGEWGFHTLMWICSSISNDIHFALFTEELIKIVLISLTALHFKDKINATLFMFAYLTFFYFLGFNQMRQMLALSVVVFGLRYYFNEEHKKFLALCLIATTIHTSAIFSLLIYLIQLLRCKSVTRSLILNLGVIILIYSFHLIIMNTLLSNSELGLYSTKAELYMEKEGAVTAKSNLLLAFAFLAISIVYKFWKKEKVEYYIFATLIFYNLFFLFMSPTYEVSFRLSWYQVPFIVFFYLHYARKYPAKDKLLMNVIFIALFSLHFIISAIHGLAGTIPYSSKILGIY